LITLSFRKGERNQSTFLEIAGGNRNIKFASSILIPHNGTTKSGAGMRKQHAANFKAKVVQEFLKEDKTITQIAAE
jgi:hypothetical protein